MLIEFNPGSELQMDVVTMSSQEKSSAGHAAQVSPEVSTSISEFLEQERLCKELCTTIASDGMAASVDSIDGGDFTRCDSALNISDLSDDDIGSILEKMSQIMSPSKSSQGSGSLTNSTYDPKSERNIEEILHEAQILMQESLTLESASVQNQTSIMEPSNSNRDQSPNSKTISTSSPNHSVNYSHKSNTDLAGQRKKTDSVLTNLASRLKVTVTETKERSVKRSGDKSTSSVSDGLSNSDEPSEGSERSLRRSEKGNQKNNKTLAVTQQDNAVNLNETYLITGKASSESKLSEANSRNTLVKGSSRSVKTNKVTGSQDVTLKSGSVDILSTYKGTSVPRSSHGEKSVDSEEKCLREYVSKGAIRTEEDHERSIPIELRHETIARKTDEIYEKINEEIRVEIEQVLKSKEAKLDELGTPMEAPILNGDFPNLKLSYPGLETPSSDVPSCFNLEKEFLEERKRCLKLKADLEWIGRLHMEEVAQMQKQHDEEMFSLKKEIVILTAQLSQRVDPAPTLNSLKESERHKVEMLEKEMADQELLLAGYQRENELLCAELRSVKKLLKKLMSLLRKDT